ncbi:MAG: ATPase [Altererythrobacter sp.]|nr:ATPase [Altererythrobacter sp.]
MTQIALPLDVRGHGGTVRIVVGHGNRAALDALAEPERWPFSTAVLVGPERSGKSLLAGWFAQARLGDAMDDAHLIEEAALFHAWNRAQEGGRPLLLTARPGWRIALPDLASRLGGSLQLAIHQPEDTMMADLLGAHAEQRRLALGEGAAAYIVPRIERSHAAVEQVVEVIDRLSLERQVPVTMSVWRDAIEAVRGPEQGRLL